MSDNVVNMSDLEQGLDNDGTPLLPIGLGKNDDSDRLIRGLNSHYTNDHGPHQIFVNVEINQLEKIDTVQQTFRAEFTVTQCWQWSREDEENCNKGPIPTFKDNYKTWRPDPLTYPNALEKPDISLGEPYLRKYNQVWMVEKKDRVYGEFQEKFELDNFPFDCQDFRIQIKFPEAWNSRISPNPFWKQGFVSLHLDQMTQRAFKIYEPVVQLRMLPRQNVAPETLKDVTTYNSCLEIYLKGKRYWKPYFVQIIMMMMIMSLASLLSFTIDKDDAGDQLAFSSTLFLTKVAFQFALSTMLPKLSYLTILDEYILISMLSSFLVMLQLGICSFLKVQELADIENEIFRYLLIANFSIIIVGNLAFGIYINARVMPRENKKLFISTWQNNKLIFDKKNINKINTSDKMKETIWKTKLIFEAVSRQLTSRNDSFHESSVANWFAIKMPGDQNFSFYGNNTVDAIFDSLYSNWPTQTLASSKSDYEDMDLAAFKGMIKELWGHWILNSENGVDLLATQIIIEDFVPKFVLRKVTGTPNFPAGRIYIKTEGIPIIGKQIQVTGKMQDRKGKDEKGDNWKGYDLKGFEWKDIDVSVPQSDIIIDQHNVNSGTITTRVTRLNTSGENEEMEELVNLSDTDSLQ